MKSKKALAVSFLLGLVIGIGGMWAAVNMLGGAIVPSDDYSNIRYLSKAGMLMNYVNDSYYRETDMDDLADGMYKGIVAGLDDPYSVYMTEDEYENWKLDLAGNYCGIGITISGDDDGLEVVRIVSGSPADEAGFEIGDIIKEVDGKSYDNVSELADAIRGREGTRVTVTYERNSNLHTETLVRERITVKSVESRMIDDYTGYVAITSFKENVSEDFKEAVDELKKKGADRVVIDLRDNGGGLLDEGIKVADALLDSGNILTYIYREGKTEKVPADSESIGIPYVVLVNGQTASASEIVTAAVKDNEGGMIVGTKTFGKGIIQSTKRLSDGTALKLTVVEYRSPLGNVIHEKGIKPDYVVSDTEKQLQRAVEIVESTD